MTTGLPNKVNHDEPGSKVSGGVLVQFLGLLWRELSRDEIEFMATHGQEFTSALFHRAKEALAPKYFTVEPKPQMIAPEVIITAAHAGHHCKFCKGDDQLLIELDTPYSRARKLWSSDKTMHLSGNEWGRVPGEAVWIRRVGNGRTVEVRALSAE